MTLYDDPEDRCTTPSRRRFFGNRSPKKQAEVRAADRKAMHKPPDAFIDRAAMKAAPGSELARARIAAHAAFDPLWQSGKFSRGVAYEWLASELGIPVTACHMVLMDVAMCGKVVAICSAHPACKQAAFDLVAADFEDLTK